MLCYNFEEENEEDDSNYNTSIDRKYTSSSFKSIEFCPVKKHTGIDLVLKSNCQCNAKFMSPSYNTSEHVKDFNMMKMISTLNSIDNVNSGVPSKDGIIDRWHRCKFRLVKVSGHQNQCLQFCLNAFYHDVDNIKKSTILWSCVYWSKQRIFRLNDNAFLFNRMLGCNTTIFDEIDKKNGNMIVLMILRRHVTSISTILMSSIFSLLQIPMTKILMLFSLIILLYKKQIFILLRKY